MPDRGPPSAHSRWWRSRLSGSGMAYWLASLFRGRHRGARNSCMGRSACRRPASAQIWPMRVRLILLGQGRVGLVRADGVAVRRAGARSAYGGGRGAADAQVRVPIHGRAVSLYPAVVVAVCLCASATAQGR